ncbi:MAG TPA: aminoglycoside phosphotransferase family protein [Candidatus Eisenbacteria bacterium]|nr:aminoglycoside phosphotransferase family protein [Candidatus Eisenbacteria bacterium]
MILDPSHAIAADDGSGIGDPGWAELGRALVQALGEKPATLLVRERLKPRVFRLRLETHARVRSLIAKRMDPAHARRNEHVIRRWLPAQGMGDLVPELLGVSASPDGTWVWHVYEDLGPWELASREDDPERLAAAVRKVAALHARFALHPVLAECRLHGVDFGPSFMASNLRDAIAALEGLRPPRLMPSPSEAALRDRLLDRLRCLQGCAAAHAETLARWGGPETLLHGDLWTTNVFAEPAPGGARVRLVDWDRAGVGSASYDLSAFLLRFPPARRAEIVTLYREALGGQGWNMPGTRELNALFAIAELARYANRVIWPALALIADGAGWGFDELAAVEGWFEALGPVLPEATA